MFQLPTNKINRAGVASFQNWYTKKKHTMHTHLFVKQPQRCNGQRVHHDLSLGRTWARFQILGRVKPKTERMIFISSIIGVVSGSCYGVRIL